MSSELSQVIESVSKDKRIDKEVILDAVNESVVSAAHKLLKTDPLYKDLECQFNEYNELELFEFKKVVDDVFQSCFLRNICPQFFDPEGDAMQMTKNASGRWSQRKPY